MEAAQRSAASGAEPILEARGLGVEAEGRPILAGVAFSLPVGEALAILGPNGAGKSTLLRCLLQIQPLGSGEVLVEGRPLAGLRPRERARLLAYLPQLDGRGVPFTVREFVAMSRYAYVELFGGLGLEDRRAVDRALEMTGMAPFSERPMSTLSGGERQQAHMAAALAQEARVLLLDEPTAFLDYGHRARIHEILSAVRGELGTTLVLVTHDVNEAVAVADRVLALRAGRVVFAGSPGDLLEPEVLRSIYGVGFSLVPRGPGEPPLVTSGGRPDRPEEPAREPSGAAS
ncbi:MAG: ABC transporter ATP-binding protein [Polyangia bacterium]|jgi:iron complex transport system ATP-binding protein|nr:ABC transporter ATP-binding protein [Polyangia bacterium]